MRSNNVIFAVSYDVKHTTLVVASFPRCCLRFLNTKMQRISLDQENQGPIRSLPPMTNTPSQLPNAKTSRQHPFNPGANASLFFAGTATTIMFVDLSVQRPELMDTVNGPE